MEENKKQKKLIIMIALISVVIMFIAGITYAFFTAIVENGDRGSSITINTATLGLRYSEDPITCLSNGAMPGDTCTHNFFVENIGNATVDNYYVYLWDIINTFETTSDLVYEITCKSVNSITRDTQGTCTGKSETEVPTEDSLILSSSPIDIGVTHEYEIKLTFKETSINQNENQGKTFTGKILVVTEASEESGDPIAKVPGNLREAGLENYWGEDLFLGGSFSSLQIESLIVKAATVVPNNVLGSWDVSEQGNGSVMAWYTDKNSNGLYEVTIGQIGGVIAPVNSEELFAYLENATLIDVKGLNTSQVENMEWIFYDCTSLTTLDLRSFNTSKVKIMGRMFGEDSSLISIDVSSFNTENVTDMAYMFGSCSSLTSIDVRSFDTSKVKEIYRMFFDCSSLTSIDVSSFNTENVENSMWEIFYNCSSLTTLDLRSFNTSKVTSMQGMFSGCESLTTLNIHNFNFTSVNLYTNMFSGVPTGISITANAAGKTWLNSNFPTYTNITVV